MKDIVKLSQETVQFEMNRTEIEALAKRVCENALAEGGKLAETLWQLKALQEFIDILMGKDKEPGILKPSAITLLKEALGSDRGTITVGQADINLQSVEYKDYAGCCDRYDVNVAKIAALAAENKAIENISAGTDSEILHSEYGMVFPCKKKPPVPKLVIKLHRL